MGSPRVLLYDDFLHVRQVVRGADRNRDGALSVSEVVKHASRIEGILPKLKTGDIMANVKRMDRNRDGVVTLPELFRAAYPDLKPADLIKDVEEHEAKYQKDYPPSEKEEEEEGEEEGEPKEIKGVEEPVSKEGYFAFRDVFARIDTDGSGEISFSEIQENRKVLQEMHAALGMTMPNSLTVSDFKRIDKDRTGKISVNELLRALHPDCRGYFLNDVVRRYEKEWRDMQEERNGGEPAEENDEGEGEAEEEGEEEEPAVIDTDEYLYYKDCFEQMDDDQSGKVSSKELHAYINQNGNPFGRTIDLRSLDKDRDGYVSFEELLRAAYSSAKAWQVRKDLQILANRHGAPPPPVTKPVRQRSQLQQTVGSTTPSQALVLQSHGPGVKAQQFDERIRELELKLEEAERAQRHAEKARAAKLGHCRPPLTAEGQEALNKKMYYHQLERMAERAKLREQQLEKEMRPPKARWINTARLGHDEISDLNLRLYDDPVAAAEERRKRAETMLAESVVPPKVIDTDDLSMHVQRLYSADQQTRKEKREQLQCKYQPERVRKVVTPDIQAETSHRLYHVGVERRAEREKALRKKYVEDTALPTVKLTKEQQKAMVGRLGQ